MAVASTWPWRRAWMRPRDSGEHDADGGGGGSLQHTGGDNTTSGTTSTTSGTTYTTSSTPATSDSTGEPRPRDLRQFTSAVLEEHAEGELDVAKELEEDVAKKLDHIKGLVVEFRGDDSTTVQRWLSELDAGWVLHLAGTGTHEFSGSAVTSHGFQFLVESWTLALRKIAESILTSLNGCYSQRQSQRQDRDEGTSKQPSASEFTELVQAVVLKMLPFIDIAAAVKTTDRTGAAALALAPAEKLQTLIDMHVALSMASQDILSLQVESIDDGKMELGDLLSAYLTKLDEAIWGTIVDIMNIAMAWTWKWTNDSGSSDIHKVTKSTVSYTKVLWANYGSLNRTLDDAVLRGEFVPENENVSHVSNLIVEMVSSTTTSFSASSFLDESLRFLFLINNSYYLLQKLRSIRCLGLIMESLIYKVDEYIDSYLHESWAPVLKCLQDPFLPCCFTRYLSPLPKFESKFHKTYATQKLWKVPDPEMRRRLRKAVFDKVIPVFTQFLEDHSMVTPRFTTRELEKMLGELFEG